MSPVALAAFSKELDLITKEAGLKDAVKAVPRAAKKVNDVSLKASTKVLSTKPGQALYQNFVHPLNTTDLAHAVGNTLGRIF